MLEEGFLRRWARRKTEVREGRAVEPASAPQPQPQHAPGPGLSAPADDALAGGALDAPSQAPVADARAPTPTPTPALPTMEDVAALGADSDFSAFVARGVDQAVRRSALKKLFADPHFNVMDRLDVYIDDYTQPSPVSEAMLASLNHAKSVFMRAVEDEQGAPQAVDEAVAGTIPEAAAEAAPAAVPAAVPAAHLEQPPEQETQ